jgi:hypothetical protein
MTRELTADDLPEKEDLSEWTHPLSLGLKKKGNQDRGSWWEEKSIELIKEEFGKLFSGIEKFSKTKVIASESHVSLKSEAIPDATFKNQMRKRKYTEAKCAAKRKNGTYEVCRLKVYDNGETGNDVFDYLLMSFVHPTKGVFVRSMTHAECVNGIRLGIFKYSDDWGGYGFRLNNLDKMTVDGLEMYEGLDCIGKYEFLL